MGILCLARSCVGAADMHDVCVWLWRASRRSFQELRGSLRVASAADCCAELSPFHASLCHVGQRCQGLQHCDWVLRVWFSRVSGPRRRVVARWSLWVASAADRCAELSPLPSITAPCRPEMSGASAFGYYVLGLLSRQGRLYARRMRVALACEQWRSRAL